MRSAFIAWSSVSTACTICACSQLTCQNAARVMDLPPQRLWVREHQVEEKQCPRCFHLTRASFPVGVKAPAQYGTGIQTLATYLVEGQSVPYARASQLLQELLGVQLSAGSIASFVKSCHEQLAEVETSLKEALVKTNVIHQDAHGTACRESWMVGPRLLDTPAHPLRRSSEPRSPSAGCDWHCPTVSGDQRA